MDTKFHATTILAVRRGGKTVIAGDGQVSNQATIMKAGAVKIRRIQNGRVLAGFAGAVADALALFDRFEAKLSEYNDLRRAAVELAKDWRTDRYLRRLEAMLLCADESSILLVSGNGEVIEPDPVLREAGGGDVELRDDRDDAAMSIGSGGNYAVSAARALLRHSDMGAREIAQSSMRIAGELCVYTNEHISIEEVAAE